MVQPLRMKLKKSRLKMSDDNFIFTEGFNCGKLLVPCLKSFFEHHNHDVHVFLSNDDIEEASEIVSDPRVKIINVTHIPAFNELWSMGHRGTALAFASAIKQLGIGKNVFHFDSDVIFKDNCIDEMINYLDEGYDIVGPCRPYKNNLCNSDGVRQFDDTISTYCFGINTSKIPDYDFDYFVQMCAGLANPLNHPVLDFFDGVVFATVNNGGKIKFLSSEDYGGLDHYGNRDNGFESNTFLDCGKKIVHFAGVGSGYAFDKNNRVAFADLPYKEWALGRWCLYSRVLFDQTIDFDKPTVYGNELNLNHNSWCAGPPDQNLIETTLNELKEVINNDKIHNS